MADRRRVVSEIVTRFLLDTCQRRHTVNPDILQSLNHCYQMAAARPPDDVEFAIIPLTTGSVAEFYIRPMYSCIGDVDIMYYRNNRLAIPAGQSPPGRLPADFHSRVNVYSIIDSEYAGYVHLVKSYLLTECIEDDMYNAVHCPPMHLTYKHSTGERIHGPASVFELPTASPLAAERVAGSVISVDRVPCVRCLSWPPQAADWPTRHRDHSWPDSVTVDCVVSNGCDVVQVAHRLCRHDEWNSKYQWRLSFSRAEVVLLHSWTPVQQIIYHMLRVVTKIERLAYIPQFPKSRMFSNYNIKTLLLWACELKPTSWWTDDLNVVRICIELLHTLAVWLTYPCCPHYFINNCNLFGHHGHNSHGASRLLSITESSLADWFVDHYIHRCAQHRRCPVHVSWLFDDLSTSRRLRNAVSAVAKWSLNTSLLDYMVDFITAQHAIMRDVNVCRLTVQSCLYQMRALANIDQRLSVYFTAVVFLHIAYKASKEHSLNDELLNILATTCLQSNDTRRCIKARHSNVLSLSQATKLMKVVANNSRSTVQLIDIELSKAYLYRALRCKDSDNDSIYCLTNVYLAVLHYTTGQYQTAIDHCTLVPRSQDHSQRSLHAVQGELLPKIDDNMDNVLGLAVFYQCVRTAALNQQQQRHVSIFSPKMFANYLHIRCLSVTECRQFAPTASAGQTLQYQECCRERQMFTADILLCRITNAMRYEEHDDRLVASHRTQPVLPCHFSTLQLADLLQQSAVKHLTTFRQLEAQEFGSVATIVTTDFESLYAYKRGDYQRCLQLSTHNFLSLIVGRRAESRVLAYPEFIQLMDDDIASLTGLTLLVQPLCRKDTRHVWISQLSLSLYLMTQCQMKLPVHHPVTSLDQTLDYIQLARRDPMWQLWTLDQLLLKLSERKLLRYISVHC